MLEASHNSVTIDQSREMVARVLERPISSVQGYVIVAVAPDGEVTFVSNGATADTVVSTLTDVALEITRTYLPGDPMPFDPE